MITFLNDVYHPNEFEMLEFADFAVGFDGFFPGGSNCVYDTSQQSVRIQGDQGTSSSLIQTESMDLNAVDVFKIAFRYSTENMNNGDGFVLEVWDETSWSTVLELTAGRDFANGVWDYGFVRIESESINSPEEARIRFRSDASNNNGTVYLMDVGIYRRGNLSTNIQTTAFSNQKIEVYPNPGKSNITIRTELSTSINYKVLNQMGQILGSGLLSHQDMTIDISSLALGVYYLQFEKEKW